MKKQWTRESAQRAVTKGGAAVQGKVIYVLKSKGLSGLMACGACDYLTLYCGMSLIAVTKL